MKCSPRVEVPGILSTGWASRLMWEQRWVHPMLGRRVDLCSLHETEVVAGCLAYPVDGGWKSSRDVLLAHAAGRKRGIFVKLRNWASQTRDAAPGIVLAESKRMKVRNWRPSPECANQEEWSKSAAEVLTKQGLVHGKNLAEWAEEQKWQRTLGGILYRLNE